MNNKFNTDEFFERFPHTLEAEMQVRTIFEEGYGEIDHLLGIPMVPYLKW